MSRKHDPRDHTNATKSREMSKPYSIGPKVDYKCRGKSSMKIRASVSRLSRRILHSRLGQILFVIHLVLAIYIYGERGSISRPVHPHYESFLMNVLICLDLPALILASIIASPIAHESSPLSAFWWAHGAANGVAFLCASLQWWCLGYVLASFFRRQSLGRNDSTSGHDLRVGNSEKPGTTDVAVKRT